MKPFAGLVSIAIVMSVSALGLAQPEEEVPPVASVPPEPPAPIAQPAPVIVEPPPLPAVKPDAKADVPHVHAVYDGGIKFRSDDDSYELRLSFRNQVRFEATRRLDDETPTRHNQWVNHFLIVRARMQAEGHAFGKDNRYKVEVALGDGGSFGFVKEMYIDKRLANAVYVRTGLWRRPFFRQELVSDFASTFNERSLANELAGGGRDLGLAVHNDYDRSPAGIEWALGVFNGFSGGSDRPAFSTTCTDNSTSISCVNSRPTNFPADFGPTVVAHAGFNSPKMKGYSESDLEGGPLRYAVGGSYKIDLANFTKGTMPSWAENMRHGLEVDALIKVEGLCIHAGAVMMKLRDADPEYGILLQPGYMVVPKHVEVAGRFSLINEKIAVMGTPTEREQIEARAALAYYWHGNALKVAGDGGFLQYIGDGANNDKPDLQFRVQMQLQL